MPNLAAPRRTILLGTLALPAFSLTLDPQASSSSTQRRSHEVRLWDPAGPSCILLPRGVDPRDAILPTSRRPRPLESLFGPGVTEATLSGGLSPDPKRPSTMLLGSGGASFLVVYTDSSNEGFWDSTLGPGRRTAFEFAAQRLVDMIQDPDLVISVDASMDPQGTDNAPLASSAASQLWMDSDLPFPNAWYGEPLFSHLSGADPDTNQLDITVNYNSSWDASSTPWYYGLDSGAAMNEFHFVVTTLHELVHGLDFADSFMPGGGTQLTDPGAFDLFCVDANGTSLVALPDVPSTVTGDAFWSGSVARLAWQNHLGNTGNPPLFAPTPFDPGSSIAHWDEASFESPWDLMTPSATLGEPLILPDPLTRGLLVDLGWTISFAGVYCDPLASGSENGKPHTPWNTLPEGLTSVGSLGKERLYLGSGTYDVQALLIDQPVLLVGWPGDAIVQ